MLHTAENFKFAAVLTSILQIRLQGQLPWPLPSHHSPPLFHVHSLLFIINGFIYGQIQWTVLYLHLIPLLISIQYIWFHLPESFWAPRKSVFLLSHFSYISVPFASSWNVEAPPVSHPTNLYFLHLLTLNMSDLIYVNR